ncbi:glycosyl transferase family 90-domain-containing protein [Chytriomyces sp. MP71]|nr:glycosyl transferase family 90-domain-containing protein [Chytriomyces sp. MP71]
MQRAQDHEVSIQSPAKANVVRWTLVAVLVMSLASGIFLVADLSRRPHRTHLTAPQTSIRLSNNSQVYAAVHKQPEQYEQYDKSYFDPANVEPYDFSGHDYLHIFSRLPPRGFSEWLKMAETDKCTTHVKSYAQIYSDLDPWMQEGRIDPKTLIFPKQDADYIQVNNYRQDSYFTLGLQVLFRSANLPPFKFLTNLLDEPVALPATDGYSDSAYANPQETLLHNACLRTTYNDTGIAAAHSSFTSPATFEAKNTRVPVFSQVKPRCYADILMPMTMNHIAIAQRGHVHDPVPWERKKKVLFWRGSTTDGDHTEARWPLWRQGHRMRLGDWANAYAKANPGRVFDAGVSDPSTVDGPLMVDVGFHAVIQCEENACNEMKEKYSVKQKVPLEKTMEFKYLLVVDGNTWPNRLQSYLETNSVLLYNGIFIDWYSFQLRPWIHFVPVRVDLADLEERLEWLQANDGKARQISENARALMAKMNEMNQLKCYVGLLFIEYSNLFNV